MASLEIDLATGSNHFQEAIFSLLDRFMFYWMDVFILKCFDTGVGEH